METAEISRADGQELYNGFLWPSESWWLGHERKKFSSRWNFGYVALSDGRFAVEGYVWAIREGVYHGRKNNFSSRSLCIRAAAARLIRCMRGSRSWDTWDSLNGELLAEAVNWVLETVARETGKPVRRLVSLVKVMERQRRDRFRLRYAKRKDRPQESLLI